MDIIIVEDERIIALSLEMTLKKHGHNVIGNFPSGESCIAFVKNHEADVVLMDIHIEGKLDGIDTAKLIKKEKDIPIIFVTAYDDDETIERARELNPSAFLTKPLDIDLLDEVLMNLNKEKIIA